MKVIGFTGNYGEGDEKLQSYLVPDSSILYSGRPFFLPDFASAIVASPTIIVRMSRLGKCVAPKFAHRYWDAFTAGFTLRAVNSDDDRLHGLDRAFDGAVIVGDWVTCATEDDPLRAVVETRVGENIVSAHSLSDMRHSLDDLIAACSRRCSIKMGDLLITGDTAGELVLESGNKLMAFIGSQQMLDVKVRL